jgi:DNA-binding NarL/FixJ family response regulator
MKSTRVVIVDDHPLVCFGLTQLLENESDLKVIGQAASAPDALRLVEDRDKVDLLIVDISLRGESGLELIKQVRALNNALPIIAFSMHDERFYAERALRAGARAYVNKQEAPEQIVRAIRNALLGKIFLSELMTDQLLRKVALPERPADGSTPVEGLTDRELQVFELIGLGRTTREIARALHLSVKTISTYRDSIKRKFNLESNPQLIRRAVLWATEEKPVAGPPLALPLATAVVSTGMALNGAAI